MQVLRTTARTQLAVQGNHCTCSVQAQACFLRSCWSTLGIEKGQPSGPEVVKWLVLALVCVHFERGLDVIGRIDVTEGHLLPRLEQVRRPPVRQVLGRWTDSRGEEEGDQLPTSADFEAVLSSVALRWKESESFH